MPEAVWIPPPHGRALGNLPPAPPVGIGNLPLPTAPPVGMGNLPLLSTPPVGMGNREWGIGEEDLPPPHLTAFFSRPPPP
ncbi:MAG: hypothetical protein ACRENC_05150, partial [Gemmatimonadaceae bacterium]